MTPGRRHRISARPLAWLVLPLAVIVTALILLFGRGNSDQNLPPLIHGGVEGQDRVALQGGRSDGDGTIYRPVTPARREAALQRLAEFRARYRQARPFVVVSAAANSEPLDKRARDIGSALSSHGLGRYSQEIPALESSPDLSELPAIYLAPRDTRIARELLWALEPYLAGHIAVVYDGDLRTDQVRLHLRGHPRFSAEGEAIFDKP